MQNLKPERLRKLRTWSRGYHPNELITLNKSGRDNTVLDLCSNDYLGLSKHPDIIKAAQQIIESDGVGAGSSRLITGTRPIHDELEACLARWLGVESVLLFPSGYQANLAAVIALSDSKTTIFADRLVHNSLLTGIKLSGSRFIRFKHNDLNDLAKKLSENKNNQKQNTPLIITEGLFSMEGTSPDIKKLLALSNEFDGKILFDEAHSLGILGREGRGISYGLRDNLDIISGTFGKSFGSGGAFLGSSKFIREHLIQYSDPFRYTTALAPPLCAASLASLKLIENNPDWSKKLLKNAALWRAKVESCGWARPPGNGHILSLVVGSDKKSLRLQRELEKQGLLSVAIRPPTVPEGTARLRISLRRNLPEDSIERFISAIVNL